MPLALLCPWLAEVFPWREPTLATWQRAVNQMQGMIARRSQPADVIQIARNAVTPAPDKIPPVEIIPKPVRGTAILKEAIASSIIG